MIAALFLTLSLPLQTPALKTDPKPPAVTAPSVPELPEVVTLKLQNIQLQATMAYKDLENSEAGRTYKAILDALGAQIRALTAELEAAHPGYTLDTTTLKLVPKVAKKDGK